MGQVVFSPLGQGILTGKYKSGQLVPEGSRAANSKLNSSMQKYLENESLLEAIGEIEAIAHELEITMPQLALAWILRQPGVSSAIIGASRPEQIEDNIKSVDIELTDELLLGINQILLKVSSFKPRS
ncbi:MAG TPA: aldo/keto reductase, partial [Trichococcus flocculiformis]|nr:aldo/keto reductase [Trichococcus flocculiformis]